MLNLEKVNTFLEDMNRTTSSNNKIEIIRNCEKDIKKLLYYTYNNFLQFNIKPKNLEKNISLCNKYTKFNDLFDLLDSLNHRLITGHKAIEEVNGFILNNKEYKDLFYLILERNLKIRASVKLINKAIPGLIPTFNVALANKFDEKTKKKVDLEKDVWYVSRKLDGVRCLIVVDEKGKAKSYSRAGKQFHTLSLVEKEIESLGFKNVVYDGEMCIVDNNNDEDFQSIMKEINRKNHTIQNGLFQVFDYIPYRMFSKGYGETGTLSQRIMALSNVIYDTNIDLKHVRLLSQIPINNWDEFNELNSKALDLGWEGLMLRKNDLYKGKRSNDILKVKMFHDDEYIVEGANFGPFRYVSEGKEVEEDMLTAVTIKHKGNVVSVGSGFTIEQRKSFYKLPLEIIGKTITVQYFEESQNQNGEYSLRFPVIKAIYDKKRET
tara:strand:- start:13364 stop:14668 length:1305 start_codon:yes stop_codon:yes gene_type:complete